LEYVVEETTPRRGKIAIGIGLIFCIALVSWASVELINTSRFQFSKEGHTTPYRLASLSHEPEQGRTVYKLPLGTLTPDEGVSVSFYVGYLIPDFDYEVEVITSDGQVLFRDVKNTGAYATVYPDRVENLTLTITPYCTSCSFNGYEGGTYTYYSTPGYFEFKVLSFGLGSVVLAIVLEWMYVRMRKGTVRLLVYHAAFTVVCLSLAFSSWYLYAYGYEVWYVPAFFGLLTIVADQVLTWVRPKNHH